MTSPLRVVFCGTPEFAVPALERLAADDAFDVVLVVTQPDRPVGRKRELLPTPVKEAALRLGLEVVQPEKLNHALPELEAQVGRPDLLVVVAYGQILSDATLAWPTVAPVNVHGSLLPRWRGASPVEHAILAGDAATGVTIQKMVRELDAGDVLSQREIAISPDETGASLRAKLAPLGADLLAETLRRPLVATAQDPAGVTTCRTLSREDGRVDPHSVLAQKIERMVRAFTPWPGVTLTLPDGDLKVLEASLSPSSDTVPLPCGDATTLYLRRVQPPSRTPMTASEWQRGRQRS